MTVPPASAATRPRPFGLHGAFESADLDEIQSAASAAQHPLRVDMRMSSPRLRFQLHHHPLARLALTHAVLHHDGPLRVWAPPLESHYFLQVPLRGSARASHGGRAVAIEPARSALLLSPGAETTVQSLHGFEEITLEIDAAAMHGAWAQLTGSWPDRPVAFEPALRLDVEPGASIGRLIRFLVDDVSRPASALATGAVRARLEEALLVCLLQSHPHSLSSRLAWDAASAAASVVSRAEAWMEARAGEPITITAVARSVGVTIRSLQRAFERHRGYTPRGFLRRERLRRVRALLRRGDATTVTQAAIRLGFRHLGRFSGDYRAQFGESPSSTLRRAHRRHGTTGVGDEGRGASTREPSAQRRASLRPESCGFCAGDILTA